MDNIVDVLIVVYCVNIELDFSCVVVIDFVGCDVFEVV